MFVFDVIVFWLLGWFDFWLDVCGCSSVICNECVCIGDGFGRDELRRFVCG